MILRKGCIPSLLVSEVGGRSIQFFNPNECYVDARKGK